MPGFPIVPTPQAICQAYDEGLEGWIWNKDTEEDWDKFCGELPNADDTLSQIKDVHKQHKRVLLYKCREQLDPGAFSKENQAGPDCTSHGDRTSCDITRCVEILIKDEPEQYHARGATEPGYGARGHGGGGSGPGVLARFRRDYGFLFRENYPGVVDLRKYTYSIGRDWGRRGVPANVKELCRKHNVGELVVPKTVGQSLDCIASGYGGHSGQSWGTSAKQPKDGINRGPGPRWNHDMATGCSYDLSEEFFKEPVVLFPNSWGEWNEPNPIWVKNQDVYGPWIPGFIVMSLDEYEKYCVKSGSIYHYADVKGFPQKTLPSFLTGVL